MRTFFVPLTTPQLEAIVVFGTDSLDPDLAEAARWCGFVLKDAASLASTVTPNTVPPTREGVTVDGGARPGPEPSSTGCDASLPRTVAEGLEPPTFCRCKSCRSIEREWFEQWSAYR